MFCYKLNIKEDLTLKFKDEKFIPKSSFDKAGIGEYMNILDKYKDLKKEIQAAVDETLEEILMLEKVDYKIFTSWLTKTAPGDFSDSHRHSNSWLSGVYYPKGDPGFSIKFHNDTKTQFQTSQNYTISTILQNGLYILKIII